MTRLKICFDPHAWEDYLHWQENNPVILQRINSFLGEIRQNPRAAWKKASHLRHEFEGLHSLHLNPEHRLVYAIRDDLLIVLQCRYHN